MADKDDAGRFAKDIRQANTAKALDEARLEYIRLLGQDDWRVTARAFTDGRPILKAIGIAYPTECTLVDKVLDLLKCGHPIKAIGMGEPQGVHGIAHVVKGGLVDDL